MASSQGAEEVKVTCKGTVEGSEDSKDLTGYTDLKAVKEAGAAKAARLAFIGVDGAVDKLTPGLFVTQAGNMSRNGKKSVYLHLDGGKRTWGDDHARLSK